MKPSRTKIDTQTIVPEARSQLGVKVTRSKTGPDRGPAWTGPDRTGPIRSGPRSTKFSYSVLGPVPVRTGGPVDRTGGPNKMCGTVVPYMARVTRATFLKK